MTERPELSYNWEDRHEARQTSSLDAYDWEAAWNKPEPATYNWNELWNKKRQNQAVDPTPITTHNGAATKYGQKALDAELAILRGTPEGQRNHQLFKSSAALAELVAGGELPDQNTRQELHRAALEIGL